jgi:SAM-dependent methyltransferase
MAIRHLPYEIDEKRDRFSFYETFWKHRAIELLLRHTNANGKKLLDYGCGRGETLRIAHAAGFDVTGTDVDPECVRLASKFGLAIPLDIANPLAQFGAKSFDVVACFHVLEHVDDPKKVLNTLAAISREYVLLAVPNLRNLHRLFHRNIDINTVNEGHLQSWDHWHLRNLAERHCGLKLVDWGFDATILPFASNAAQKFLGTKATVWLETKPFRKLFPFHGVSIIGLFKVQNEAKQNLSRGFFVSLKKPSLHRFWR